MGQDFGPQAECGEETGLELQGLIDIFLGTVGVAGQKADVGAEGEQDAGAGVDPDGLIQIVQCQLELAFADS